MREGDVGSHRARALLALLRVGADVWLAPFAYADPPDPRELGSYFDGAYSDDVELLAMAMTSVVETRSSVVVNPMPEPPSPSSGPLPTRPIRAPPPPQALHAAPKRPTLRLRPAGASGAAGRSLAHRSCGTREGSRPLGRREGHGGSLAHAARGQRDRGGGRPRGSTLARATLRSRIAAVLAAWGDWLLVLLALVLLSLMGILFPH